MATTIEKPVQPAISIANHEGGLPPNIACHIITRRPQLSFVREQKPAPLKHALLFEVEDPLAGIPGRRQGCRILAGHVDQYLPRRWTVVSHDNGSFGIPNQCDSYLGNP
jgi:hypothetical protein